MKKALSMILKKINNMGNVLTAFVIAVLLIISLVFIQGTLGRFSQAFLITDSAMAAKFDVDITAPDGIAEGMDGDYFECRFLSDTDIKGFNFSVRNNGEADVLCVPHMGGGVNFRVFVAGIEQPEFIVKTKERVDFWLIISSEGIDTEIKDAGLFIDIMQPERR